MSTAIESDQSLGHNQGDDGGRHHDINGVDHGKAGQYETIIPPLGGHSTSTVAGTRTDSFLDTSLTAAAFTRQKRTVESATVLTAARDTRTVSTNAATSFGRGSSRMSVASSTYTASSPRFGRRAPTWNSIAPSTLPVDVTPPRSMSAETSALFDGYKRRSRPEKYFTVGKVFQVLVAVSAEELSVASDPLGYRRTDGRYEEIFPKIRRYIVIREASNDSMCLPIRNYGSRGVGRPGVKKSEHGIVYSSKEPVKSMEEEFPERDEQGMNFEAVRVVALDPTDQLDKRSRIDYGTIHRVPHNSLIKKFGEVQGTFVNVLRYQFKSVWLASKSTAESRSIRHRAEPTDGSSQLPNGNQGAKIKSSSRDEASTVVVRKDEPPKTVENPGGAGATHDRAFCASPRLGGQKSGDSASREQRQCASISTSDGGHTSTARQQMRASLGLRQRNAALMQPPEGLNEVLPQAEQQPRSMAEQSALVGLEDTSNTLGPCAILNGAQSGVQAASDLQWLQSDSRRRYAYEGLLELGFPAAKVLQILKDGPDDTKLQ